MPGSSGTLAHTGGRDHAATTSRPDDLPGSVDVSGCGSMDLLLFMIYCHGLLLLFTPKCAKTMGIKDAELAHPFQPPLLPPILGGIPHCGRVASSKKLFDVTAMRHFWYLSVVSPVSRAVGREKSAPKRARPLMGGPGAPPRQEPHTSFEPHFGTP